MDDKLTIERVLQICIHQLNAIPVTVGQIETIGNPIKEVIQNLSVCVEVISEKKKEAEEEHGNAETE